MSATHSSRVRTPELREVQDDWRRGRVLESIAEYVSRKFSFNESLKLVSGECGQPNAYYMRDRKLLVLCLELFPDLADRLIRERGRKADRVEMGNLMAGALYFIVLHELGHALIDVQSLPVLGREEDAADQISAFLVLGDEELAPALAGAIWFFGPKATLFPGFYSQRHLSDEHSLGPQRAANIACWAYGRDPQRYAWALQAARVTSQRAARCADEYAQLDRSVRGLLKDAIR